MNSPAQQVADLIIRGQTKVVGKAAYKLANRIDGLKASSNSDSLPELRGDEVSILDHLVREFSAITGPVGARMCYLSAARVLREHPDLKIPSLERYR